jgi:hypothetical protein
MKADFSRGAFEHAGRYAAVLAQQGRVQLDADWNEQAAIMLYAVRAAVADLIGWHGTPGGGSDSVGENGFEISVTSGEILIGSGHYYVDGILSHNAATVPLAGQPFADGIGPIGRGLVLLYLDVWERCVTVLEDPSLREVALGGPDTTARLQTVWQVRTVKGSDLLTRATPRGVFMRMLAEMGAAVRLPGDEPCAAAAGAGYTGLDNRLYRVEIHAGGDGSEATFKWSRDNASVAFRVERRDSAGTVVVSPPPAAQAIAPGDHVELETSAALLAGRPGVMNSVVSVDGAMIGLAASIDCDSADTLVLRCWDSAPLPINPGNRHELEDGLAVTFSDGPFRTGDYWQFAARGGVGIIDWPAGEWRAPFGVGHHYAPLALVRGGRSVVDLRRTFTPLGG